MGNPINSKSKNRDGIIKKDSNLNRMTVNNTVPNERRKRTVETVNEDNSSVCLSVIEKR